MTFSIFNRYVYSEPFLMGDDYFTNHYYQWRRNIKTNEGKLIKVKGQKSWGITTGSPSIGLSLSEAVFPKN